MFRISTLKNCKILLRSVLDNILCGIMYRFRVRAFNEIGNSIPGEPALNCFSPKNYWVIGAGIPSDAFVIDTPGVHIAPYFILCPPPEAVHPLHDTVQVSWYKWKWNRASYEKEMSKRRKADFDDWESLRCLTMFFLVPGQSSGDTTAEYPLAKRRGLTNRYYLLQCHSTRLLCSPLQR